MAVASHPFGEALACLGALAFFGLCYLVWQLGVWGGAPVVLLKDFLETSSKIGPTRAK